MKFGILAFFVLAVSSLTAQQQRYNLAFDRNSIDIVCSNQAQEGFYKDVTFTSTVPIRVLFQKNDKAVMEVTGLSVSYSYKRNEQAEYVADLTVDGKSWWSVRCIFFVTANVDKSLITFNGQPMEINGIVHFPQTGTTFSVSKLF